MEGEVSSSHRHPRAPPTRGPPPTPRGHNVAGSLQVLDSNSNSIGFFTVCVCVCVCININVCVCVCVAMDQAARRKSKRDQKASAVHTRTHTWPRCVFFVPFFFPLPVSRGWPVKSEKKTTRRIERKENRFNDKQRAVVVVEVAGVVWAIGTPFSGVQWSRY